MSTHTRTYNPRANLCGLEKIIYLTKNIYLGNRAGPISAGLAGLGK